MVYGLFTLFLSTCSHQFNGITSLSCLLIVDTQRQRLVTSSIQLSSCSLTCLAVVGIRYSFDVNSLPPQKCPVHALFLKNVLKTCCFQLFLLQNYGTSMDHESSYHNKRARHLPGSPLLFHDRVLLHNKLYVDEHSLFTEESFDEYLNDTLGSVDWDNMKLQILNMFSSFVFPQIHSRR